MNESTAKRRFVRWLSTIGFVICFLVFGLIWSVNLIAPSPAVATAASTNPYQEGMAAYDAGDYQRAVTLLSQVPRSHPRYAQAMRFVGYNIFAREWNRPEEGVPYVNRAFIAEPFNGSVLEDISRSYQQTLTGAFEKLIGK